MQKREGIFKAQKARAILVAISDAEAFQFILAAMEETWVIKLKDPDTYYNEVTVRQLLDHLAENCDCLNNTDAVDVRIVILAWWDETPSVPKYILRMEKRKNKAEKANCPI